MALDIEGRRATVVIDRPSTRNAIDRPTMLRLQELLDEVEARCLRDELALVAIRGGGDRVFVSGGDLKELAAIRTHAQAEDMATTMRQVLDRFAALPVPTVAILNGHAYGGGAEVALACDFRVAVADVLIAFKQVAHAIMPAWGGVERLTSLVGRSRALDLLFTGRDVTARQASEMGLVDRVFERDEFTQGVDDFLQSLTQVPPAVAGGIKGLVDRVVPPSWPQTADQAVNAFATTWVADEHWAALRRQDEQRRRRRSGQPASAGSPRSLSEQPD